MPHDATRGAAGGSASPHHLPDQDQHLRQHLMQVAQMLARTHTGWRYPSIEALVLAHGRPANVKHMRPVRRGEMRACYRNALETACMGHEVTYVEGYALPGNDIPLPILHAWCVDANGALLEPTWPTPGAAYLGIPFDIAFVLNTIGQRNRYGVLDAYDLRWPLLQHGLPDGALAVNLPITR